eukprot:GFUD01019297.1.p1 GENE.GFUD01019297.1~~GFUD01019297.1.p1  ORF type:complete len:190 (-),score=43.45 GFUD01019297.1:61-606(-)
MFSKVVQKTIKLMARQSIAKNLINKILPTEMLERIFLLLTPGDIKMGVLVCRRWRDVGEDPRLWSWVMVTVTEKNLDSMPDVMGSKRMSAVKTLGMRAVSDRLIHAMVKHPGLRKLEMHANMNTNLSSIDPPLLARALGKLDSVDMFKVQLTCQQAEALMNTISSGSNLQHLNIGFGRAGL